MQTAARKSSPSRSSASNVYAAQIAALNADIASLRSQLDQVGVGQADVVAAVEAAQQALAQTQGQIAQAQAQLNKLNAKLRPTGKALAAVNAAIRKDKQQIAEIAVSRYEVSNNGMTPDAISALPTPGAVTGIADAVTRDQQKATTLQAQMDRQTAPINSAMNGLAGLMQAQMTEQANYQAQGAQLTGQAQDINNKIAKDQAEIAALQAAEAGGGASSGGGAVVRGGLAPFALGSRFDSYPWGQCTWYVASLRTVTWAGDAWMWAGNAARQGYSEGMLPEVGAIVVWGPGNGYSGYGHVAYVAQVKSPTDFVVNEANYLGLGVVDSREVTTLRDVEAFIY